MMKYWKVNAIYLIPCKFCEEQPSKHIKLEPDIETGSQRFLPQTDQEDLPNMDLLRAPSNLESIIDFGLGQPESPKNIGFNSPKRSSIIPYQDPQIGFDFLSSNFAKISS